MKASPGRAAGPFNCGDSDRLVMMMSAMTFSAGGGGDFKRLEPGTHPAVCDMVVLMGYQPGSAQFPKPKLKVAADGAPARTGASAVEASA